MNCPIDNSTLLLSERQGVEIDYCPECRGVWLDRGELDKLVARADRRDDRRDDYDDRRRYGSVDTHKRKKKNWLSEVFEFGD